MVTVLCEIFLLTHPCCCRALPRWPSPATPRLSSRLGPGCVPSVGVSNCTWHGVLISDSQKRAKVDFERGLFPSPTKSMSTSKGRVRLLLQPQQRRKRHVISLFARNLEPLDGVPPTTFFTLHTSKETSGRCIDLFCRCLLTDCSILNSILRERESQFITCM